MPSTLVITRFLWPLPWPLVAKIVIAVLMLVASQFQYWSKLSSGSIFAPEFPRAIVILFNWAGGAILFLAVMQLLADVALTALWLAPGRTAPMAAEIRYAMAAIAIILAGVGVYNATRVPSLKDVRIEISGLPPQFEGYTLVQLTDLHISRLFATAWTSAVVDRTNALDVDLIVITGDVIDGSLAMRRANVEPLRDLRARDGVFMSPGNHEYFLGYQDWIRHFAEMGMHILANDHVVLQRRGGSLVLAGVTDSTAPATGMPPPDLAAALAGAPVGPPVILLDHQPGPARMAASRGVALQLSGHTHGGMLPGLDRLVAMGNSGFVSGRYTIDGMTLYVNNGTGIWPGFAMRLGRPAELTRITLHKKF
ncbi:metallophosphoesterase [Sphingobium sp.]|uniref:metallophosphoesterase n=1 Tax=Sphingobium sp. TaxID=1912891 RepID=UPI002C38A8AC|nr:metallophosphoesterase [Sphingobium sp.]HUD95563.1 metallophosphoesterase [Sphingobium sp.]